MIDTITAVLELAEQPMRARDIHTAAEQRLGRPIKWTSVKATLAKRCNRWFKGWLSYARSDEWSLVFESLPLAMQGASALERRPQCRAAC